MVDGAGCQKYDIIIEFDKGTTDYLPEVRDLGTLDHLIILESERLSTGEFYSAESEEN
jgi:hypothetical protein